MAAAKKTKSKVVPRKHYGKSFVPVEKTMSDENVAWQMRSKGETQQKIAEVLGINQATVSKMLSRARKVYHVNFVKNVKQVQCENIALYNGIISEAMTQWKKSIDEPDYENAPHGNPEFLKTALKASERLAKALGTDAPAQTVNKNVNKNENKITSFTLEIPNANKLNPDYIDAE